MPQIYNNGLTPTLWGTQGNVKPVTNITTSNLTIGGLNGQIQYNDNGALNGTSESFYDKTVGMLTLGPVSNVNITGGVPGQVLTKDATGNMMWANSNIPNQPQIHWNVPVTGVSQSFAHPNLATFQDSTYAGVFRNGILMPTDAYTIVGSVLSISTMLLAGDRVDVLETAAGTVQTGNIGNVNLNGDPTTFLDGTGNWQLIASNVVVGTVAPLNLDGNVDHWLRGDGVWANIPVAIGNISNIDLNGNTVQFLNGNGSWTNIAVPTGNIANTNYDGNAANYLNGQGNWVPIAGGNGIPGGANTQLQFNNNGVLGGVPNSSFNGTNLTLGSNTNIKLTGGNVGDVLLTDGTGNLSWRGLVNYAAVPRMEFQVLSNGAGQSFMNPNLAVYPNSNYATVFRNGVLMDPTDYNISGSIITFSIPLYSSESIDIAASASVGNGSGTIPNVLSPYVEWNVPISAAGQTFTSPYLSLYADKSDLSLFRNGVLISPSDYTLSGNSIVVSTFLAAGDNLEVISKLVSSSGGSSGGNVNTGNITASGNVTASGNLATGGNLIVIGKSNLGPVSNVTITGGTSGQFLQTNGNGVLSWATPPAGSSVAGSNTEIQFNDGGVFGADANLSYVKSVGSLLSKNFVASAIVTTPTVNSQVVSSLTRDLLISSGSSSVGSGNIRITSGGNSATDGGNIFLQSGFTGATSNIYIGNPSQVANSRSRTTITGDLVFVGQQTPPATAASPGVTGEIRWASGFIYVCVATNTWQRSPLATW